MEGNMYKENHIKLTNASHRSLHSSLRISMTLTLQKFYFGYRFFFNFKSTVAAYWSRYFFVL